MIRATDLTCRFGDHTAVDAISFNVPPGEIFAFLGPNGAGKTTTVRMLTTLLPVSSGSVQIDGLDPMRQPTEVRRRLFSATFSGMGLVWERQFGVLKATLVAPVPRFYIMLGRTLGSATVAFLQGALVAVICVLAGLRWVQPAQLPVAAVFVALLAVVFASLGTVFGATLKEMQTFQWIMNFVVMPMFFLSGGLYPLDNLPATLAVLARFDPLSYGVDGLRAAFLQQSHFGVATDAAVLVVSAVILMWVAAWRLARIAA